MIPKNPENMCRELETHFDVLSCMIVDAVEADAWYFLVKKKKRTPQKSIKYIPFLSAQRLVLSGRRRAARLYHFLFYTSAQRIRPSSPFSTHPDQLRAHFDERLVLGEGDVREQWPVSDNRRVGITLDVGLPLPACRVGVASTDKLGLEALEFLLRAELIGLCSRTTR